MARKIRFVDIYILYDDLDASIIEELLEECNIDCIVRDLDMVDTVDRAGMVGKRVAVEAGQEDNARQIIRDAIRSGLISSEGSFET